MASITKRGRKYLVRWWDPGPFGGQRGRTCPDYDTARKLAREVERTGALGHRWEPDVPRALPALAELAQGEDGGVTVTGGLFADFLEARRARLADGTRRHYDRALLRFFVYLAHRHPTKRRLTVDLLTRDAVEGWFGALTDDRLPAEDRLGISTARLYTTAVMSAWDWAYDSDEYGDDVPRPRRPDLPVAARAPAFAPSWAQMDAVIAQAYVWAVTARTSTQRAGWLWRARLATLLRFTGLRVDEQALQLQWEDFDLDRCELALRGELGKSRQERTGRMIPLAPALVEAMRGWGIREGFVVAPALRNRHSDPRRMRALWEAARVGRRPGVEGEPVPARIYGVGPGRAKANVHHAFRKGFKTGLSGLGAATEVRHYLVGHHLGIDEHYLELLEAARAAVGKIPPLSEDVTLAAGEVATAQVVPFRRV